MIETGPCLRCSSMSYLDRIQFSNHRDLAGFIPWKIEGRVVGYLRPELRDLLDEFPDVFHVKPDEVRLHHDLSTFESRSLAFEGVLPHLRNEGYVRPAVGECYGVVAQLGGVPFMRIDRGAVEGLGIITTGFHLNGLVGDDMWIARRSLTKPMFPGQLDNMVAGGWPVGLTLQQNVVKECAEEAGMNEPLACQAEHVGVMTYVMEIEKGLRRHAMYLYDLQVPDSFVPRPVDGEVDSFQRLPVDQVSAIVRDTTDFKYNSSMAVIDYLHRSGRITSSTPGYSQILKGLHVSLENPEHASC